MILNHHTFLSEYYNIAGIFIHEVHNHERRCTLCSVDVAAIVVAGVVVGFGKATVGVAAADLSAIDN